MRLSYILVVKRPSLLYRLTGLTVPEFEKLLDQFSSQYALLVVNPRLQSRNRVRSLGGGRTGTIPTAADKLLFILMYARVYPLLIVHGLFFGMAESRACEWVGKLLPVLDAALGSAHVRPKRARGRSLEQIIEEFPELVELGVLSDGVERPIRRPKDQDKQKEQYSGKKKRHTTKRLTIGHPRSQYILAVSDEYAGRTQDKKMADECEMTCQSSIPIGADSGLEGFVLGKAKLILPIKKKRKPKAEAKDRLTDEQKAYNTALASSRIGIEHSYAGFKRNRSAADILRNTRAGMGAQLTMVAMGLHNLRVAMRISYQTG